MKKCTVLALSLALALFMAAGPALGKNVRIKVTGHIPSKLPGIGEEMNNFIKEVENVSQGGVKIKFYEPGKLVPPTGVLEAVSKGLVGGGFVTPAYWTGKMSAAAIFHNPPFGMEPLESLAWFYKGNGLKLYQEMLDKAGYNVKILPCIYIPAESGGWFAKEIKTPEDIKGLKVRWAGLGGQVLEKMGASVSFMPMGDVFPALEKGALDAVEFSYPQIDSHLGFHKVVKYNYYPGWQTGSTTVEFIINKEIWDKKLSAHQRAIIELCAKANLLQGIADGEAVQAKFLRQNAEKRGVKNIYYPPEVLDAFEEKWEVVRQEESAKDPFFKKVMDDFMAFRKDYALWAEYGFLPRKTALDQ